MKYFLFIMILLGGQMLFAQQIPRSKEVLKIDKLYPDKTNNYVNLVATELQERLLDQYHFRENSIYKILVASDYSNKVKSRSKKKIFLADVHIKIKGYNILNPVDSFVLVKTIRGRGEKLPDIYKNAIKKYWRDPEIYTELQNLILAITDQPCEKFQLTDDMLDSKAKLIRVDNALKSMLPNNHCIEKIQELKAYVRDIRDSIFCKKEIHLIKNEIDSEHYNPTRLTERLIRLSPYAPCRAKAIRVAELIKDNLNPPEENLEPILDSFIKALENQDIHTWSRVQMML